MDGLVSTLLQAAHPAGLNADAQATAAGLTLHPMGQDGSGGGLYGMRLLPSGAIHCELAPTPASSLVPICPVPLAPRCQSVRSAGQLSPTMIPIHGGHTFVTLNNLGMLPAILRPFGNTVYQLLQCAVPRHHVDESGTLRKSAVPEEHICAKHHVTASAFTRGCSNQHGCACSASLHTVGKPLHKLKRLYYCEHCPYSSDRRANLMRHLKRHIKENDQIGSFERRYKPNAASQAAIVSG